MLIHMLVKNVTGMLYMAQSYMLSLAVDNFSLDGPFSIEVLHSILELVFSVTTCLNGQFLCFELQFHMFLKAMLHNFNDNCVAYSQEQFHVFSREPSNPDYFE